jgi:hypothetical protein
MDVDTDRRKTQDAAVLGANGGRITSSLTDLSTISMAGAEPTTSFSQAPEEMAATIV